MGKGIVPDMMGYPLLSPGNAHAIIWRKKEGARKIRGKPDQHHHFRKTFLLTTETLRNDNNIEGRKKIEKKVLHAQSGKVRVLVT